MRALYEERLQQQQSTASREVSLLWCGHSCPHTAPCHSRFSWLQGAPHTAASSAWVCWLCILQRPAMSPCPLEIALPTFVTFAVHCWIRSVYEESARGLQQTFQPCSCVRRTLRTWWQPRQCSRSGRRPSARRARPRRPRSPSSSEPECSMLVLVPGPSLASSYKCMFSVLGPELHAGKLPVQQHVEAQILQRCR